ncbi:MAG: hypothetical protein U5J64_05450 [Halobacteriales archaeon]|nr:hypothetical protein [Halobacteriales archaeon]
MATEAPTAAEKHEAHVRGVKVTAFSCVPGRRRWLLVSWMLARGMLTGAGLPDRTGFVVLAAAVLVHQPFLPYLGKNEMSKKDWAYVAFMTFDLWFITWTVLLTAGTATGA